MVACNEYSVKGSEAKGYQFTPEAFDQLLNQLKVNYHIYTPVLLKGKGRFSDTDIVGYGIFKEEVLAGVTLPSKARVANFIDFGGYKYDTNVHHDY